MYFVGLTPNLQIYDLITVSLTKNWSNHKWARKHKIGMWRNIL